MNAILITRSGDVSMISVDRDSPTIVRPVLPELSITVHLDAGEEVPPIATVQVTRFDRCHHINGVWIYVERRGFRGERGFRRGPDL